MKTLLLALSAGLGLACPASWEPPQAVLFARGAFDGMPDGQAMTYGHVRGDGPSPGFQLVIDGRIVTVAAQAVNGQSPDGLRRRSFAIDTIAAIVDCRRKPA